MNLLMVDKVTKCFGKKKVINNVSFNIIDGEILGLVGPNGAGKTTIIKCISNLLACNEGEITICSYNIRKDREKALSMISSIIESPSLYSYLTGREHLKFIAGLRKASNEYLNEIIDLVDIGEAIDYDVKRYSLGMKQRLAIGLALLPQPKLLILDEPTNGLDPSGIINLRKFLIKIVKEKKISILISSHNLDELGRMCDRIVFIKNGEISSIIDNTQDSDLETYSFDVDSEDVLLKAISALSFVKNVDLKDGSVQIKILKNSLGDLISFLTAKNIKFYNLKLVNSSMELQYSSIFGEEISND